MPKIEDDTCNHSPLTESVIRNLMEEGKKCAEIVRKRFDQMERPLQFDEIEENTGDLEMDMNAYQRRAGRTRGADRSWRDNVAASAMGLSGEAGEVTDMLKKVLFHGHTVNMEELTKELGDVLWYLSDLASSYGLELQDIAERNLEKLEKRYPDGFSEERSQKRTT